MEPIEILQEFNLCYQKIQAIAQDENWLLLIAEKKIDPEAGEHPIFAKTLDSKLTIEVGTAKL